MSNCRDKEIQLACFVPDDGSDPVTINHTIVYDNDGMPIATYFSDREGGVIDETAYLGGGVASVGSCDDLDNQVDCIESQEWTYGIDNTGTRFNDVADYEIDLSDGTKIYFSQDGSSGSWTDQLIEWSANIQQAADDAGLAWFAEPRFIDNNNPTNIDGTINGPGGTPSGLPGAPSEVVAQALFDGGMAWRYVNIQICPGQPVPVAARRLTSATFTPVEIDLTTAGPVLGPVQRFFVCRSCGEEPVWYIEDGVTEATSGQIPDCYLPCGFLSLQESPPGRTCDFVFDDGCDDNGSTDPADFTSGVTRRLTVCDGVITTTTFFIEDPADPTALINYDIVGTFVDCASGVPVEEPEPEPDTQSVSEIEICADNEPAIKKITVSSDGTETVEFLGLNGEIISPNEWKAGSCNKSSECVKWKNKYVGIDNTATSFSANYVIETRDADGNATGTFVQTPQSGNTEQLNQWIDGLQTIYPDALIEQRYAPNGGAGLPPPSSDAEFTQMAARFVQFTACDGDELPSSLVIIEQEGNPVNIVMDVEVVFGVENRGYVCYNCGEEPVLFYSDGTEVPEEDIPPCYITCGEVFNESGVVVEYTTSFDSEFFNSAFTVPTAPADTKEVVVFNNSGAWMEFSTNYGTQIVPPGGTASWEVNDYEDGMTFSSVSLISGSFGPNDNWAINYRTAA